uniref:Uncharacterized protein n=1 Tax=Globodera pallida TaxID=36090 RepID=A0A183CCK2_GLOPA
MDSSGKKTKLVGILMRRVELEDNANEYNVWFKPWRASLVTSVVGSATGAGTFVSYDALPSPAPSSYPHMASMNPFAPPTAHRPMMMSDDWTDDLDDTLRSASENPCIVELPGSQSVMWVD